MSLPRVDRIGSPIAIGDGEPLVARHCCRRCHAEINPSDRLASNGLCSSCALAASQRVDRMDDVGTGAE